MTLVSVLPSPALPGLCGFDRIGSLEEAMGSYIDVVACY